jgi:N-acetyl-1-D-myo-inositol-2-amino-2-deoxy-alpha-D-glucopyranoside deacetylase/mycothiol S-conjugate amidase
MAAASLTLMAVHAHPDDEVIGTGGILARYAAEGVQTVLVTCTRGEVGEIVDRTVARPESLADARETELRAACAVLQVSALHFLGYRDSGMVGTPAAADPRSFRRAASRVPLPAGQALPLAGGADAAREDDLFAGLRGRA